MTIDVAEQVDSHDRLKKKSRCQICINNKLHDTELAGLKNEIGMAPCQMSHHTMAASSQCPWGTQGFANLQQGELEDQQHADKRQTAEGRW